MLSALVMGIAEDHLFDQYDPLYLPCAATQSLGCGASLNIYQRHTLSNSGGGPVVGFVSAVLSCIRLGTRNISREPVGMQISFLGYAIVNEREFLQANTEP